MAVPTDLLYNWQFYELRMYFSFHVYFQPSQALYFSFYLSPSRLRSPDQEAWLKASSEYYFI